VSCNNRFLVSINGKFPLLEVIKMAKLTRREFLFGAAAAGISLTLRQKLSPSLLAGSSNLPEAIIPNQRVVHTHSNAATFWDYATGWYGDYVDQSVVDTMTELGMMDLTGASSRADAWRAVIPAYSVGQKVAIKINLNNASCNTSNQVIDALPQPINSVILGLKEIGVPEDAIRVYDVTRGWHNGQMPARLVARVTALYPNIQFHSYDGGCSTELGYSATEKIHFNVPPGRSISDRPICNALVEAAYLINMPIMKKHGMAGVTLGFKNHFGSIDHCDYVHWSVELGNGQYLSTYNGLVDIYNNPHFKGKTVLTIGDALYGARINNYNEVPSPWPTFGNRSPNSLFFSKDPVAIDCVMYDFLGAEGGVLAKSDDYLKLAQASGLGTFEHWDAAHQYHMIDYRKNEVDMQPQIYLPLACHNH
jgi:hypothetical protein